MFESNATIQGFDAAAWSRFIRSTVWLWRAGRSAFGLDAWRPGRPLFTVDLGRQVLGRGGQIHGRGWQAIANASAGGDVATLARDWDADQVVGMSGQFLDAFPHSLAKVYQPYGSMADDIASLARAFRAEVSAERLHMWPNDFALRLFEHAEQIPRLLQKTLKPGEVFLLGAWRGEAMWTGAAIQQGAHGIAGIWGPDFLKRWAGPLGGDWRRDRHVLVDSVSRGLGPVKLGIFSELATLETYFASPRSGALARSVLSRDLVIEPNANWIRALVVADAARAGIDRTRGFVNLIKSNMFRNF